jgi:hypothetical protein
MREFRLVQIQIEENALKPGGRAADTRLMTRLGGLLPVSRPAMAVATVSSCALVGAATLGAVTPPVVVGALCAAAVTAVLSARSSRRRRAGNLLTPLATDQPPTAVTIVAPRASEVSAGTSAHPAA